MTENTKNAELKNQRLALKAKLMSAMALLLVSTIMLGTTTYAWFTLSTHPEVSGISTTVGANGSLEIALLDDETGTDLEKIKAEVGSSSAVRPVAEANVTWGNIVDLSVGYGFASMPIYPAALNTQISGGSAKLIHGNELAFAQYGIDGRVANLGGQAASGKYNGSTFNISADSQYGVRGIGFADSLDPNELAMSLMKSRVNTAADTARNVAVSTLDENVEGLVRIAISHALATASTEGAAEESYSSADTQAISDALDDFSLAVSQAKLALQNAVLAKKYSVGDVSLSDPAQVDLNESLSDPTVGAYISALNELDAKITGARAALPSGDGPFAWENIRDAFNALIDSNGMTIGDKTSAEIRAMSENEQINWGLTLMRGTNITTNSGMYADLAKFVGDYNSTEHDVYFETLVLPNRRLNNQNILLTFQAVATDNPRYLDQVRSAVSNLSYTAADGDTGTTTAITTLYGYAIDLAFRTNVDSDLRLQTEKADRVSSGGTEETMGGGSTFKLVGTSDIKIVQALRVAFVDATGNILAIGKLDSTASGDDGYPLHLYTTELNDEGVFTLTDTPVADDKLLTLTANTPTSITAVLYLEGDDVDGSMGGATGTLNLQFASSETLVGMEYSGYLPVMGQGSNSGADSESGANGEG